MVALPNSVMESEDGTAVREVCRDCIARSCQAVSGNGRTMRFWSSSFGVRCPPCQGSISLLIPQLN